MYIFILFFSLGIYFFNDFKNTIIPEEKPPEINAELKKIEKDFFLFEWLKRCNIEKGELVRACNFEEAEVRRFALNLASNNEGNYNIGQVADIFDYVYDSWKYISDPKKSDYIAPAS